MRPLVLLLGSALSSRIFRNSGSPVTSVLFKPNKKTFDIVLATPITSDEVNRHEGEGPCWTTVGVELIVCYKSQDML